MRIFHLPAAFSIGFLLLSPFAAAAPTSAAHASFLQIRDEARAVFSVAPVQGDIETGFGATRNGARIYASPLSASAGVADVSFHRGVDFPGDEGAAIVAPGPGRVSRIELNDLNYGIWLEIDHGDGLLTRYAHLSAVNVRVGDTVASGQIIAGVGHTGAVRNNAHPHLHFEVVSLRVHPGAEYFIDPETVLPTSGAR